MRRSHDAEAQLQNAVRRLLADGRYSDQQIRQLFQSAYEMEKKRTVVRQMVLPVILDDDDPGT